jgi:hypothetical protein
MQLQRFWEDEGLPAKGAQEAAAWRVADSFTGWYPTSIK